MKKVSVHTIIVDYEGKEAGSNARISIIELVGKIGNIKSMKALNTFKDTLASQAQEVEHLTLRDVLRQALDTMSPDEPWKNKIQAFGIMQDAFENGSIEIEEDDIEFIMGYVSKTWSPLVCGRVYNLLTK